MLTTGVSVTVRNQIRTMLKRRHSTWTGIFLLASALTPLVLGEASPLWAVEILQSTQERYSPSQVEEVPDFRRHLVPLLGRLGCNGRTCHGSFQGQGGFRLSLFGYDLKADHQALTSGEQPRVDVASPLDSLILFKPTHEDEHGGGERMKADGWQFHLIRRWIESGAAAVEDSNVPLVQLEVLPREIVFASDSTPVSLQVVAHWSDGSAEDVTPLCRFQTNDESIADVSEDGVVTGKDRGDTHVIAFYDSGVAVAQVFRPVSDQTALASADVVTPTKIDELIVAKLRKLGIVPSQLCTDAEFLRRVSLDMTGTLPALQEIEEFLADTSPSKRTRKIDELLARPTYVARWTTKLCEITGNSPRHFQDQAPPEEYARNWYEWIARRVQENVPYDQLVAGIVLGLSRQPEESYQSYIEQESAYYRTDQPADFTARETMPYYWAKQSTRLPEERALNFSYTFLGVRIECAQCHRHPFDRWTQDDFQRFTAFFNRIGFGVAPEDRKTYQKMLDTLADGGNQAQRVRARLVRAQQGEVVPWQEVFLSGPGTKVEKKGAVVDVSDLVTPRVLGGSEVALEDGQDPRVALLDWMRRKDNPYFARVFINRVWAEYFGIGIINPPDDMNLANPPSNAALLDYLAEGFINQGFDMKWLHREIANSHAYQRSLASNETNQLDERNFSRAVARRLPAASLFDAITQATAGAAELEHGMIDLEERAIGPRGGALAGRYRDNDYASTVFGRSPRDVNCDCSASNEPNLLQAIYMQNDKDVLTAMNRGDGWLREVDARFAQQRKDERAASAAALVREAFLRTLSREPTAVEVADCVSHLEAVDGAAEGLHEVLWALLNTREFITNH